MNSSQNEVLSTGLFLLGRPLILSFLYTTPQGILIMQLPSKSFPVKDNDWKAFMFLLLLISLETCISLFELTDKGATY